MAALNQNVNGILRRGARILTATLITGSGPLVWCPRSASYGIAWSWLIECHSCSLKCVRTFPIINAVGRNTLIFPRNSCGLSRIGSEAESVQGDNGAIAPRLPLVLLWLSYANKLNRCNCVCTSVGDRKSV